MEASLGAQQHLSYGKLAIKRPVHLAAGLPPLVHAFAQHLPACSKLCPPPSLQATYGLRCSLVARVLSGHGVSDSQRHDGNSAGTPGNYAAWLAAPVPAPNHKATAQWALVERKPFAGGWLEVVRWEAAPSTRALRVWLPPGFYKEVLPASSSPSIGPGLLVRQAPPAGGWPVFYLNDGQNLFEDHLSFSGHSWRAAHTAQQLISSGQLPPFVVVGMDHAGTQRSFEYTPCKPGTGPKGWRSDAANWPGGGVDEYVDRVIAQVLPWAETAYAVSKAPEHRGFGGSSFGGICALCMAMRHPGVFGSLLVESPSLWIGNECMLREDLPQYKGTWQPRMYIAMGGAEYKGDGSAEFSTLLVRYLHDLRDLLTKQGASLGSSLVCRVEDKAAHTESAWAARLPEALCHLCAHWRA